MSLPLSSLVVTSLMRFLEILEDEDEGPFVIPVLFLLEFVREEEDADDETTGSAIILDGLVEDEDEPFFPLLCFLFIFRNVAMGTSSESLSDDKVMISYFNALLVKLTSPEKVFRIMI